MNTNGFTFSNLVDYDVMLGFTSEFPYKKLSHNDDHYGMDPDPDHEMSTNSWSLEHVFRNLNDCSCALEVEMRTDFLQIWYIHTFQ